MTRDEVKLANTYTRCSLCEGWFETELRNMGNGTVRNQPRCKYHRNTKRGEMFKSMKGRVVR